MGGLSIWHWLIVLLIVALVFGTKKLRNIGSDLGSAVKGFKDGMKEGDAVRVRQGERTVQLPAVRDENLAETVVRVSAATPAGAALGSLSGELVVEKA